MQAASAPPAPRSAGGKRIIPTKGGMLGRSFFVALGAALALTAFAVAWESYQGDVGAARNGVPLSPLTEAVSAASPGLGSAALFLVVWTRTPRSVTLGTSGITISYPMRPVRLPWTEPLEVDSVRWGTVSLYPATETGRKTFGYPRISVEQARAILDDPRCLGMRVPNPRHRRILTA